MLKHCATLTLAELAKAAGRVAATAATTAVTPEAGAASPGVALAATGSGQGFSRRNQNCGDGGSRTTSDTAKEPPKDYQPKASDKSANIRAASTTAEPTKANTQDKPIALGFKHSMWRVSKSCLSRASRCKLTQEGWPGYGCDA